MPLYVIKNGLVDSEQRDTVLDLNNPFAAKLQKNRTAVECVGDSKSSESPHQLKNEVLLHYRSLLRKTVEYLYRVHFIRTRFPLLYSINWKFVYLKGTVFFTSGHD